jgi:lysophospholipase L1-like esterase
MKSILCTLVLLGNATALNAQNKAPAESRANRWEKTIRAFEEWDSRNSFPSDAVLFVGSSSIRQWATRECFPTIPVINRGFGGSHISDVNYFAQRIVLPYRPKVIVLYAGDNDIAGGKTAESVFKEYLQFIKLIRDGLPKTSVIFIGIKPSLSRWSAWPLMKKANSMIKEFSEKDRLLFFVDSSKPLLESDGKPDTRLFLKDNLHLNTKGYEAWTKLLRPIVQRALRAEEE